MANCYSINGCRSSAAVRCLTEDTIRSVLLQVTSHLSSKKFLNSTPARSVCIRILKFKSQNQNVKMSHTNSTRPADHVPGTSAPAMTSPPSKIRLAGSTGAPLQPRNFKSHEQQRATPSILLASPPSLHIALIKEARAANTF